MDFSHDQRFSAQKAGGIGVVALAHIILGGALVYCLHSIYIPQINKPIPFTPEPPQVTKPPKPVDIDPSPTKPQVVIDLPPVDKLPPDAPYTPHKPEPLEKPINPGVDGPPAVGPNQVVENKPVIHSSKPVIADLDACKPDYPKAAIMEEEEGTVRLKLDIGANGQLMGASVMQSSGHADLDRAAVRGLSRCAFKPATQDGTPVQSSLVTDYVWSLK